ncbi:MAG: DUF2922 domain-containing protein [Romboutsia sp.]|uniref:DUF2922 domain-containing protein n=1 Tax=Romboutsia sp. TaxID=1965302 RepID=UPI003F342167
MGVETRLLMVFSTSMGRKVSLYVSDPKENLTESEIKTAMELIVETNIFAPKFEEDIVSAVEAKVITTDTTEYDLIIA